jgi:hypothetical protein
MHFKIYVRRFGKVIALQKISRTSGGIYFISPRSSSDYVSYHEDGKYWVRSQGKRYIKKLRQPLSNFVGIETLSSGVFNIWGSMPDDRDEAAVSVKPEDVVVDFPSTFGIEIILSEKEIHLPDLAGRLHSRVYIKESKPLIIVEVFEFDVQPFLTDRYPTPTTWVENSNFFVDHPERI